MQIPGIEDKELTVLAVQLLAVAGGARGVYRRPVYGVVRR